MKPENWQEFVDEFGAVKTIHASMILALNLTLKCKPADLEVPGNFEDRIFKKARKMLWRLDDKEFNEIVRIWKCFYNYDLEQCIPAGMGGHVTRSLKQIYKGISV